MVQLFVSIMVSDGGLMNTFLFIVWPCKNADFVPKEYTFKFKEKITDKINPKFSLQYVGESFLMLSFSVSSKPQATSFTLCTVPFDLFFFVSTYFTNTIHWLSFATSWKFFQSSISSIFASKIDYQLNFWCYLLKLLLCMSIPLLY